MADISTSNRLMVSAGADALTADCWQCILQSFELVEQVRLMCLSRTIYISVYNTADYRRYRAYLARYHIWEPINANTPDIIIKYQLNKPEYWTYNTLWIICCQNNIELLDIYFIKALPIIFDPANLWNFPENLLYADVLLKILPTQDMMLSPHHN